ncbi:hypothetical protein KAT08_01845 [Candidatus Babeliales bacterium]|nr:hypothetical protein [Candidatus Babeliales bacterium]
MVNSLSFKSFLISMIQPFLIFFYFLINLFTCNNFHETSFIEVISIIFFGILIISFLIFVFGFIFYKSYFKGSFFLSFCLLLFFYFIPITSYLYSIGFIRNLLHIGYNRFCVIFMLLCFLFFIFLFLKLFKLKKENIFLSKILIFPFLILILFSVAKIVSFNLNVQKLINSYKIYEKQFFEKHEKYFTTKNLLNKRDIYYIILDDYASQRNLKNFYGYDNSSFLDSLKEKGFYVAENSYSNYNCTQFSIPSFLNMNYYPDFVKNDYTKQEKLALSDYMIKNNLAVSFLKLLDYKLVFIPSHWGPTSFNVRSDFTYSYFVYSDFLNIFLNNTLLRPVERLIGNYFYRKLVYNQLDSLKDSVSIKGPKFVFAHIDVPHAPYIFDSNGNNTSEYTVFGDNGDVKRFEKMYIDQLIFISKKINKVIEYILNKSESDPIIFLHSDHGHIDLRFHDYYKKIVKNDLFEKLKIRHGILNVYYFPNSGEKLLYDSISPVNNFRVFFKYYFGIDFDLLDDISFGVPGNKGINLSLN